MEKRFTVLRVIATVWKVVAWLELIVGAIVAVVVLLLGVFSRTMVPDYVPMPPRASWAYTIAGGVVGLAAVLVATIVYFLLFYAVGELIYLLITIEENTRLTCQQLQRMVQEAPQPEPGYAPSPAPFSPPPAAPPQSAPSENAPTDRM